MTGAAVVLACVIAACGGSGPAGIAPTTPPDDTTLPPIPDPPPIPLDTAVIDLVVLPGPDDGSVRLEFTAPGTPGDTPADSYLVRSSVRHITPDDTAGSVVVPVSATPAAAGTAQSIVVRGLAPDRTLQFSVQTVRDGTEGPRGPGAGGRVTGRDVPATPSNAVLLTGPATLSQAGATYLLTRDVTTSGTAFRMTAPGITLDLGGHTVTYGGGGAQTYGVQAEYPGTSGTPVTVRNGTIVQAATTAQYGHGLFLRGVADARVSYLDVTVVGPGSDGIYVTEAESVRVDHCTVVCSVTTVPNRHYPGVSAIFVEDADGQIELDENLVTASPQWGLRVEGRTTDSALVHHNRVLGTKALVANGYMLGVHCPNVEAYENELRGESRGIHIDGVDAWATGARVHDNRVEVQDQPNAEYPDRHWAHGIKIEGASNCCVEHNHVHGTADAQHGDAFALDVHVGEDGGVVVRRNVFEAVSVTPTLTGRAVVWTYGGRSTPPVDAVIQQNVLTATDTLVFVGWDAEAGGVFWGNWWHRDLSQGAGHAFDFQYFWNSDDLPSRGFRFVDPHVASLARDVGQRLGAAAYDSTREGTLTVLATDTAGPLAGATVTVRNAAGATLWQGTTNADGRVAGIVRYALVTNGPTITEDGPHRVTAAKSGFTTREATVTVEGRTALVMDLATGSSHVDTTAPTAPTGLTAHPLSASRAMLVWEEASDDVAVAGYLVSLNGAPAAITAEKGVYLGGLEADRTYAVTVRTLDAAGRESGAAATATLRTRPEDRGP